MSEVETMETTELKSISSSNLGFIFSLSDNSNKDKWKWAPNPEF